MGTKKGQRRKTARRAYIKQVKPRAYWQKLFDEIPKARFPTGSLSNRKLR